jgi:hypothetical protein
MNPLRYIGLGGSALAVTACAHLGSTKIDYVPASDVVNAVKAELSDVLAQPQYSVEVKPGACGRANRVYVQLSNASVDISLKTIKTDTNSPVASLAGGVILSVLVSGSQTWTNTHIKTQQTTYSFKLEPPPLTQEGARALRDEVVNKVATDIESVPKPKIIDEKPPTVSYPAPFVQGEPGVSQSSPPASNEVVIKEGDANTLLPENLGIANAFKAAVAQILMVDHESRPCLVPTSVKVEVDFQISRKNDSRLGVGPGIGQFQVMSVGTEHLRQSDYTNSLVATFQTAGSAAVR